MRNILTIILLFIGFAVSAQITVNTPFKVNSNNPIDTRLNISKLSDTTTIVFKYPGLITYVQDRDQFYYYDGTTWKLFEQGGSSFIFTIDSSAQAVGLATYSLSNNNNLGFPSGTLISTGSTLYANDSLAALQLDTNEVYFLSPSNDYGTPSGVGRALYPTKTYSSDNEAILNGVDFGDIYALSVDNIYAAPANTVKEVRYLREREANELSFNTLTFDTSSTNEVGVGQMTWNDQEGTLDLGLFNGSVLQIGQEQPVLVKNKTGSAIPDGTPLRFVGTEGNSGRILVAPAIADGSYSSYYNFGAATQEILNDEVGYATPFGKIRGVDLVAGNTDLNCNAEVWGDSTILYLDASTPGCYTKVKPTGANQKIPFAAIISAGNNGTMFVRPTLFAAIEDISGVEITNPTNGQVIGYNNGVWVNTNNSGWLKDSLNSADVVIDADGNDLELNNLDSLTIQGNAVFKNAGQFPVLNINATNRLVEIPSQSTFRLSSNGVLTPIGPSTTFIAGDAENDLKPITPDAAQNLIGINGGVYSSSVDASGNATVAHGLTSAPVSATITGITDDERTYKVTNITSSNITVVVYEGNTKLTSVPVQFYWMVIK